MLRNSLHWVVLSLLASETAALASAPFRDLVVTEPRGIRVRDADGQILCSIPINTSLMAVGRRPGNDWIQIRLLGTRRPKGCPEAGFVHANYVRPVANGKAKLESELDVDGLNLRSRTSLAERTWECSLPQFVKGKDGKKVPTRVQLLPGKSVYADGVSWARVRLLQKIEDCPSEGWVVQPYLRNTETFEELPIVAGSLENEDIPGCEGNCKDQDASPVRDMDKVGKTLRRSLPDDEGPVNPWLVGLRKMMGNRRARPAGLNTHRGLVQIPLLDADSRGNVGPCGSHHYTPDRPIGIDAYANPLTACVFTSLLQKWKKDYCPNRSGCTIEWGDISHKFDPGFHGVHRSHTDGYCIDIRPPRKGGFVDGPIRADKGMYDKETTKKLINLAREYGADTSQLFFCGSGMGTRCIPGHRNHIHACFKPNARTHSVCNNLKVDPEVCPELQ